MAAVWHPLSMPSAAVGGGRRPALIGDAKRLHSTTKGDGPPQRSRSFSAEYARILTAGNTRERHRGKRWRRLSGYGFAANEAVVALVEAEFAWPSAPWCRGEGLLWAHQMASADLGVGIA